ncbi:MAG: sigma-54-dependent Fis family transcriptional regulator [Deltaproteobacteria bacterium]|nr:sigma-54-dependent Fis family transcriptional regulator [Deltaproteobacteria bacterium]
MKHPRILIVDDEKKMRRILQIILKDQGYKIDLAQDGNEAWQYFQRTSYDIVITDLKMPGRDGMELLRLINKENSDIPVIVITAYGSVESAVKAMKAGAFDYITKPFENEEIRIIVSKAVRYCKLQNENRYLREAVGVKYGFDHFIGDTLKIKNVRKLAAQVAQTASSVLIQGESGTGKELLGRLIHFNSPRSARPLVPFNCGALPDTLLESELFGYEKGAFTGAHKLKPGRFEIADTGTIFLDEVGDMSREAQLKMLRVLEEMTFERLGGSHSLKVDVRIIAATNRDLKKLVNEGAFRADLYYRLNIFPIYIPPLRDHKNDIPVLVRHFIEHFAGEIGKQVKDISDDAMNLLISHPWQGNVRELHNCLERAMILCERQSVKPEDLLLDCEPLNSTSPLGNIQIPPEGISLEEVEKFLIKQALTMAKNNQTRAAAFLKISRNTLRYRMEKHDIHFAA